MDPIGLGNIYIYRGHCGSTDISNSLSEPKTKNDPLQPDPEKQPRVNLLVLNCLNIIATLSSSSRSTWGWVMPYFSLNQISSCRSSPVKNYFSTQSLSYLQPKLIGHQLGFILYWSSLPNLWKFLPQMICTQSSPKLKHKLSRHVRYLAR